MLDTVPLLSAIDIQKAYRKDKIQVPVLNGVDLEVRHGEFLSVVGASNGGVMKIFLAYGLLLGTVGALCGTGLGLTITVYINEIEHFIAWTTGQEIFSRSTYYFDKIPTCIQPTGVILVNVGAIGIAVLFSVMPAVVGSE